MPLPTPWTGSPGLRFGLFTLAGLFGTFCATLGAGWFFAGRGWLIPDIPHTLAEAFALLAGGVAVALWSAAKLRRRP